MGSRPALESLASFGAGLLFAVGLAVAGMTNPAKVLGFLDVGGAWDPSLLLVMAAAIPVHAVAWVVLRRRGRALLGAPPPGPPPPALDARLVGGAALFGVGWGLGGVCPGPAVVSLAAGGGALVFVPAMLVGIGLARIVGGSRGGGACDGEGRAAA